jgi:hypothetical protein
VYSAIHASGSSEPRPLKMKSLSYKWTCLFGVVFLGALLWSVTFSDQLSDLFVFLFLACFLGSIVVSVVIGVTRRSKESFYRILINIIFCLLIFPTINLGGSLRDQLFVKHLSRFQEVTDLLIKNELVKANGEIFSTVASLPPGYTDLNVKDRVLLNSTRGNITARYFVRNSNALSHRGYMYRSDDNPAALSREYPNAGYTRVAPHWFFYSQ